jgi:site-specific recombinase XerD
MAITTSVVPYDPTDTSQEVRTLAGFMAGSSGRTREAYTLDLRQFYRWCDEHRLDLLEVSRTHIELYARELEELGRAPATIGR